MILFVYALGFAQAKQNLFAPQKNKNNHLFLCQKALKLSKGEMFMPTLVIFAGVNGTGKTTLYQKQCKNLFLGERVNPDEILIQFGGDWRSKYDIVKSSLIALKKIDELFKLKKSFNWETTIVSNTLLNKLSIAKKLGYKICLQFVGVDNVKTAISRVNKRVFNGGHGISPQKIEERFLKQFNDLDKVLEFVDYAIFFDNTNKTKIVAKYKNGSFTNVDKSTSWINDFIQIQKNKNTALDLS